MLKVSSLVGLCSIVLAFYATLVNRSYFWLTTALSVWGAFWGMTNTSLGALFADSIPNGERSKYFTQRSMLINAGNMAGPATALILFASLGDEWTLRECSIVIAVGNALCIPALILLCFFHDNNNENGGNRSALSNTATSSNNNDLTEPLLIPNANNDNASEAEEEDVTVVRASCCARNIPIFIATADVVSGLGSGMSVRYFPIFFVQNLQLSPVTVQLLYILTSLGSMGFKYYGQILSRSYGRCRIALYFKWIGIFLMVSMIASDYWNRSKWLTIALYMLRTTFMNSTTPLTKSVLMDAVPKESRGKWSAVESVSMFSWSGSAALGGILVGWDGLLFNFSITATLQFIATLPLLAIVLSPEGDPVEQQQTRTISKRSQNITTINAEENNLQQQQSSII